MFGGGKLMSFVDVLKSVFEIALVSFTIWSLFHEDRFIAFEEKLLCKIRRNRLKSVPQKEQNFDKVIHYIP